MGIKRQLMEAISDPASGIKNPKFDLKEGHGKVGGFIVSESFDGMDSEESIGMVMDYLEKTLGKDIYRKLNILIATTELLADGRLKLEVLNGGHIKAVKPPRAFRDEFINVISHSGIENPKFAFMEKNGKLSARLISKTFAGMNHIDRQIMVWDILERRIKKERLRKILSLMTYTPAEARR